MHDDKPDSNPPFLKRWSQRKLAAAREATEPPASDRPLAVGVGAAPVAAASTSPHREPSTAPEPAPAPLPSMESLSFDSDFTPFLNPNVDESLKRQALRKLVRDPRFNVMDGLDVYIDDYSKPDPIAPEVLAQLNQLKHLFDPPKTRVNAQGHVEDVPDEELAVAAPPPPADLQTPADVTGEAPAQMVDNTTNTMDAVPADAIDAGRRTERPLTGSQ